MKTRNKWVNGRLRRYPAIPRERPEPKMLIYYDGEWVRVPKRLIDGFYREAQEKRARMIGRLSPSDIERLNQPPLYGRLLVVPLKHTRNNP